MTISSPADLPDPVIEPTSLVAPPALAGGIFTTVGSKMLMFHLSPLISKQNWKLEAAPLTRE